MIAALAFFAALVAPLADPAQEARAAALEAEIRCVACENEPISQSTADIAADMRALVRTRIAAGDSDRQIRAYFAARYGDFVLLRPPVNGETALLWSAPILLLLAGGLVILRLRNSGPAPAESPGGQEETLNDEI
jgi:cytochrome c-type biogenesis protein CcmH